MYLKEQISCVSFFRAVDACAGTVLLRTPEGDVLNLRSQLCRYIFAVALAEKGLLHGAAVECQDPADYAALRDFLSDAEEEA